MNKDDELIWAVPTESIRDILFEWEGIGLSFSNHQGIIPAGSVVPNGLPCMGKLFLARGFAETNENFLQPIPYVLLRQNGKFIRYRRLPKRVDGETRLAGKTSIGTGGHIDIKDKSIGESIERELSEEFDFSCDCCPIFPEEFYGMDLNIKFIGYLIDRTNEVSRVHLGLIYLLDLPADIEVTVNPKEAHKIQMEEPFELSGDANKPGTQDPDLESWSQIITWYPNLFE